MNRFLGFGANDSPSARFERLARHLEDYGLNSPECVGLFAKLLFLPEDDRYLAGGLTPAREREETFRVVRQWLYACSAKQPTLFIVEDLHWSDASTLEFLSQLIEGGQSGQILTILTFRPEFKVPWPAAAHQTFLALNRLSRRQVTEWMRTGSNIPLPDSLITQVIGYHWVDSDHLAFYLIDVTGHGLDSALLSVTLTNIIRTGALSGAEMKQPAQVLAQLNEAFRGQEHGNKYFTIWYGVYQSTSRTLTWAGGGHHPL